MILLISVIYRTRIRVKMKDSVMEKMKITRITFCSRILKSNNS